MAHPVVVVLIGGPGSGKGTACEQLVKQYGFVHLSTGDLLRHERSLQTPIADKIEEFMKNGQLVPLEIIVGLLHKAVTENKESKGFLIDGFPRNVDQIEELEKILPPNKVLFLECSEETMVRRVLGRGASSGRVDDNATAAAKRVSIFKEETIPVILKYEDKGKLLKVDAEKDVAAVIAKVNDLFLQHHLVPA